MQGWKNFRKQWKSYFVCANLQCQTQGLQLHTFLMAIGQEGRTLNVGFQFSESEDKQHLTIVLQNYDIRACLTKRARKSV